MSVQVEQVPIGTDGLSLSRLTYGVWRMADEPEVSVRNTIERIEACLSLGITTFDHADLYGDYTCEEIFGAALREVPRLRDQIQIVTKCGCMLLSEARPATKIKHYDTSARHIEASVEQSLKNLNTDRIDLLLIHRPDPFMDPIDTARGLEAVVHAGKVRQVGVSNFQPWQLDLLQAKLSLPLVTNQIELNALTAEPFLDGTIGQCQQREIPPMAWSPLAGGALFEARDAQSLKVRTELEALAHELDATVAQVAMAWLLKHPAGIIPVIGTGKNGRISELAESIRVRLDRQQWFRIWTALTGPVP